MRINWHILSQALSFYKDLGYRYIEVPWMVSEEATKITAPKNKPLLTTMEKDLVWGFPVGSAEQGFLQLMLDGKLPKGRYVSCSPCFRNQEKDDEYHFPQFMKVELFNNYDASYEALEKMLDNAMEFLSFYVDVNIKVMSDENEPATAIDLIANGIELGSYGIGKYKEYEWVYGTGVAEPRLSQVYVL